MERWAQRTIDHYALIQPSVGLHVIEGIYAQDGDAFDGGPGPSGLPNQFMTNMLVFGKDAFRLDIVGHWLGGHEPGNFGLFHLARERGVSTALDPRNIPVYEWTDDGPEAHPAREVRAHRAPDALPGEAGRVEVPHGRRAVRLRSRGEGRVPLRRRPPEPPRARPGPVGRRPVIPRRRVRPPRRCAGVPRGLRRVGPARRRRGPGSPARGIHAGGWAPGSLAPGEYWSASGPAASTSCARWR